MIIVNANDKTKNEVKMKIIKYGSNHVVIELTKDLEVLFSYSTLVAGINKEGYFKTTTKWSVTTSRHINQYLEGVKAREVPQAYLDNMLRSIEVKINA